MNGIAGFGKMGRPSKLRKKQLSYGTPFLIALSAVDFGHQDHQTLHQLTSFRR